MRAVPAVPAAAEEDAGGAAAAAAEEDAAAADKGIRCGNPSFPKIPENAYIPPGLLFQWHITDRCNLRCTHCYQDSYLGEEPEFGELLHILAQFRELTDFWKKKVPGFRCHITVSGGEPFVRKDFSDLLDVFYAQREYFSFAILTNGSFIDEQTARRLKKLQAAFVQISLEGGRDIHEKIRGKGSYELAVRALQNLVREKIRSFISFTAHRGNYKEFPAVARLGKKLGVSRVWSDRLIPRGSGAEMADLLLHPAGTRQFFQLMVRCRPGKLLHLPLLRHLHKTEIAMHRALQFLCGDGRPYHCTAGDSLMTVLPNGELLPCRRMPVSVGNLKEKHLAELYYTSDLFRDLRDRRRISRGCENCFYQKLCRGGLKCLSYAVYGSPFRADPGCWRADHPDA
jgi:radical SAM protein with 4Fe4S-binding SPASM domain